MRNTLAFLAAAVLVVAGLGWYLNWYKIDSTSGTGGHREVNIDINAKKVQADVKRGAAVGAAEVQQVLQKDEAGKSITVQPRITIDPVSPTTTPSGQ